MRWLVASSNIVPAHAGTVAMWYTLFYMWSASIAAPKEIIVYDVTPDD
jgi:hypothetical protein